MPISGKANSFIRPLNIANTSRLTFICNSADYDNLFTDSIYPGEAIKEQALIENLQGEEKERAERNIKNKFEAEIKFLMERVIPRYEKSGEGKHVTIYAESLTGEPIGRIRLNSLTTPHPYIDIKILCNKQNQGFGYEMLSAVINAAFEQYEIDHLEYYVYRDNIASCKLIHKLQGKLIYGDEVGEIYEIIPSEYYEDRYKY